MAIDEALTLPENCLNLIQHCQSLSIASSDQSTSHASYAPFIYFNGAFYILISALAEHSKNLQQSEKKVGIMIIEDESDCSNIFARRRLMFKSIPEYIHRDNESWHKLIVKFKNRFGDFVELLESLEDFSMVRLKPQQAVLVSGFGDARRIDAAGFESTD